jgi:hypothetical protein
MTVRLLALLAGRLLPQGRFLVLTSIRGWVDLRALVRLEGLGQLKWYSSRNASCCIFITVVLFRYTCQSQQPTKLTHFHPVASTEFSLGQIKLGWHDRLKVSYFYWLLWLTGIPKNIYTYTAGKVLYVGRQCVSKVLYAVLRTTIINYHKGGKVCFGCHATIIRFVLVIREPIRWELSIAVRFPELFRLLIEGRNLSTHHVSFEAF